MDKLKGLSIDKLIRSSISVILNNKNIFISLVGLFLIGYTMFNTLAKLDTKKDEIHFNKLQKEVVITKFDQDIIDQIRQLDDFQGPVNSDYLDDRVNPFTE